MNQGFEVEDSGPTFCPFQEGGYSSQDRTKRIEEWLEVAVLAANVGAWVWELKPGTRKIVRNEPYNRIFGITSETNWDRDSWLKAIHPDDREPTQRKMQSVIEGKKNEYNAEYRVIRPDGSLCWVHAWGKNVRSPEGEVIRVTGVLRDISDRKRVERDRDQFVATLSHDLRNPLSAVLANVQLIQKYPDRIGHREQLLERVIYNLERADRMIQDLLDSSRLQSGHSLNLMREPGELAQIVDATIKELAEPFGRRIRFQATDELSGRWDKAALSRVIENLVGNAIKHGLENTPVTVKLLSRSNSAVLTVHNLGNPIPIELQPTLFEPFQRAAAASGTQGWGLGLTVVRGIVKAHGGHVEVRSNSEEGTTFTVTLPLEEPLRH